MSFPKNYFRDVTITQSVTLDKIFPRADIVLVGKRRVIVWDTESGDFFEYETLGDVQKIRCQLDNEEFHSMYWEWKEPLPQLMEDAQIAEDFRLVKILIGTH